MKKNSTLKRLLALSAVVLALSSAPGGSAWAACDAKNAGEFLTCLGTAAPLTINITGDYAVDLSGLSLAGYTIDLKNNKLTILGAPITVSSSTSFTGNGASGVLTYDGHPFSASGGNGTSALSLLTSALSNQPANNTLLKAVNAALGILPVTLSSFSGTLKPTSEQVQLEWITSAELNNDRFVIETSTEGEVFQRIGEIAGAGTTTEAQSYQFSHQTPSAGVNYYRLKQVDFDGSFAYSKVIAVNAAGNDKIFAFPNPAKDQLNIQYDHSKGPAAFYLYDTMGRQINATVGGYAGYYEAKLPGDLPAGTYWLRVIRSGKVQTLPIVKQ